MNIRKLQIQAYRAQLALADVAVSAAKADLENDALAAAAGQACDILQSMRDAGYAPRSFGVAQLETGDETPEEIEELREAMR